MDLVFAQLAQGGDGVANQEDDFLKVGKGDGEGEILFARQLDLGNTDRRNTDFMKISVFFRIRVNSGDAPDRQSNGSDFSRLDT